MRTRPWLWASMSRIRLLDPAQTRQAWLAWLPVLIGGLVNGLPFYESRPRPARKWLQTWLICSNHASSFGERREDIRRSQRTSLSTATASQRANIARSLTRNCHSFAKHARICILLQIKRKAFRISLLLLSVSATTRAFTQHRKTMRTAHRTPNPALLWIAV